MKPIVVTEPVPKFVHIHVTAAERARWEDERLLNAGGWMYVTSFFLTGALLLALIVLGFWLASASQYVATGIF